MADSKITALTALTAADPANDMIPIVDVSDTPPASGNTKRISINNILAASGTATLASATITGDLTVDTSTLKVDSALNFVGIGATAKSFAEKFRINGNYTLMDDGVFTGFLGKASAIGATGSTSDFGIRSENNILFLTGGANLRMTLDSAGNVAIANGNLVMSTSGKGIDFSATAGTGTSELLNDYEEGTWTPVVTAGTGTLTTVSNQLGYYTKIGRVVTAYCYFVITTNGTGGSYLEVAGLPFSNNGAVPVIGTGRTDGTTGALVQCKLNSSGSSINVWKYDNTYPAADGAIFPISITYFI